MKGAGPACRAACSRGDTAGPLSPPTDLWQAYAEIAGANHFVMRKVHHRREIYPVFRELFKKTLA